LQIGEVREAGSEYFSRNLEVRTRGIKIRQSLRLSIRQRTNQHRINQTEDRRTRADSERKRKHRHHRKRTLPPQRPQTIAKVLSQIVEPRHPARLIALLHSFGHAAEHSFGLGLRSLRRHPLGDILLRLPLQVKLQLLA
jgi:hypothetical protein